MSQYISYNEKYISITKLLFAMHVKYIVSAQLLKVIDIFLLFEISIYMFIVSA